MFRFAEVQKFHSRSACRILTYEDITHDAYMQEVSAVVFYVVILYLVHILASVLIPVLVRHIARN